jgi:hypothetical protein
MRVYSSLEPRGKQAMVNGPEASSAYTLSTVTWIDWNLLFAVDYKMSIFYAQSLTHMLELSLRQAGEGGQPAPDLLITLAGESRSERIQSVTLTNERPEPLGPGLFGV